MTFGGAVNSSMIFPMFFALSAQVAYAETASITFTSGFIGEAGPNRANNIRNFSTLGINSATFSQDSVSGQFRATQGNDVTGTLTLVTVSGGVYSIRGAINWRIGDGNSLDYFGFIPDGTNPSHTIIYPGGQYSLDASKSYGLQSKNADVFFRDGDPTRGGNAAGPGLVDTLNEQVNDAPVASDGVASGDEDTPITGSVTASDPEGDLLTFSLVTDV